MNLRHRILAGFLIRITLIQDPYPRKLELFLSVHMSTQHVVLVPSYSVIFFQESVPVHSTQKQTWTHLHHSTVLSYTCTVHFYYLSLFNFFSSGLQLLSSTSNTLVFLWLFYAMLSAISLFVTIFPRANYVLDFSFDDDEFDCKTAAREEKRKRCVARSGRRLCVSEQGDAGTSWRNSVVPNWRFGSFRNGRIPESNLVSKPDELPKWQVAETYELRNWSRVARSLQAFTASFIRNHGHFGTCRGHQI